ncbi:hypothetical protein J2S08_002853 [Bacillus chungangensis]|uniref:Uncharacterized protein n=1 Tax=Bacillus chungangensis TaxID=587633 RepID=A0ABT9WV15_9BACI|nr:hypothetical protein [Bacillus chungangensis]
MKGDTLLNTSITLDDNGLFSVCKKCMEKKEKTYNNTVFQC